MNLLEYEAKNILGACGVPIPRGRVFRDTFGSEPPAPCVVKSQVPTGGRGKAGGIAVVETVEELLPTIERIKKTEIKGHLPKSLLLEEVLDIMREYYLSIMVNRSTAAIELVAHRNGGIEVESNDSDDFFRRTLTPGIVDAVGQEMADYLDLADKCFVLTDILDKLYDCLVSSDALLIEINPLVLTRDGELVAGDCKMTLDNAARFRHDDWDFEAEQQSANFVTLDENGTIATIANGAGLAMATVDAVKDAGHIPANFLDIGGNATTEGILDSFNQLVEFPHLTNIIINIFGGIVRCDTVARAIIEARAAIPTLPPLLIRLSGTNAAEARTLLESEGLVLHETLESCLEEIR